MCTICSHPERATIESAILSGESNRRIASQCDVSEIAVRRHQMGGHVAEVLVQAHDAVIVAQADSLLDQIRSLQQTTLRILQKAEAAGKFVPAIMAITAARGNLELLAKMVGELDERTTVNMLVAPEWLVARAALLDALRPYPEARTAVAERLVALERPA